MYGFSPDLHRGAPFCHWAGRFNVQNLGDTKSDLGTCKMQGPAQAVGVLSCWPLGVGNCRARRAGRGAWNVGMILQSIVDAGRCAKCTGSWGIAADRVVVRHRKSSIGVEL